MIAQKLITAIAASCAAVQHVPAALLYSVQNFNARAAAGARESQQVHLYLDPNNAVLAAHEHTVQPTSKFAERNRFSLLFGALPFRQIGCAAA
eukprot:15671-Heterococcus_DN1.PRE.1